MEESMSASRRQKNAGTTSAGALNGQGAAMIEDSLLHAERIDRVFYPLGSHGLKLDESRVCGNI